MTTIWRWSTDCSERRLTIQSTALLQHLWVRTKQQQQQP